MLWNIWFFDETRSGVWFIGQVEARTAKAAERKAAEACWSQSGKGSEFYRARDPATDDWHRPLTPNPANIITGFD